MITRKIMIHGRGLEFGQCEIGNKIHAPKQASFCYLYSTVHDIATSLQHKKKNASKRKYNYFDTVNTVSSNVKVVTRRSRLRVMETT